MNKKIWILLVALLVIAILVVPLIQKNNKQEDNGNLKIVTSFYPVYIITTNLVQGAQNVELTNLTQNNVGCLHDYTLSTQDMKKIEGADILIQNGLGLEGFMDKIVQTYPKLKVIEASTQIVNKIEEHGNVNPHVWTSIENYKKQVEVISQKLIEYDNANAQIYMANKETYIKSLNNLKEQYDTELQSLNGKKAICLNEALIYLVQDLKMQVTSIETNHEESTLSADTIKNIIAKMKQENINIILIGNGDNSKNAETLAQETGAKIYKLDTGLTGILEKNAYINAMLKNLYVLKGI